jgi:hypothetical protein
MKFFFASKFPLFATDFQSFATPPLLSPQPPILSPLHYVCSRPQSYVSSVDAVTLCHAQPELTQPNNNGWRKTGAWHVPGGTYLAVTGAMAVSGGSADRNPNICGAGTQNTKKIISCTVVEALHFSHVFAEH